MKPGNLMLYHGLPIMILLFPFLWVGIVGNDRLLKGESGITELSTALFLFIAIGFCVSSMTLTRRLGMSGFNKSWILLLIAGATYFALEELSYGQHIFGWGTPEGLLELNDQQETNLHNMHSLFDQVPRALLTLGILVGGVVLPLYRKFRSLPLLEDARFYWQWPTMDCVTVGLLVLLIRPIFTVFETDVISTGENKEQFFALFIMLYCLSLHARLRSTAEANKGSEDSAAGGVGWSTRAAELMAILQRGESVLMDGALGTELERQGLPIEGEGWSAYAVRDYPQVISAIHRQYIDTGARIHIVNSFALARHVLEPLGLGNEFEALNRQSVALFEHAVELAGADRNTLWAAGSLSTFAANSDRSLLPRGDALVANYRDQAGILLDAGVDLFALEMLFDVDVTLAMLRAIAGFDLPAIVGFTCEWGGSDSREVVTHSGVGRPPAVLADVLARVVEGVDNGNLIFSIMHSDADVTDAALEILRQHWQGPVAIYPNSGHFVDLHLQFDSVCSDDDFAAAAQGWLRSGVQIIGGCCGIGPSHIRRLGGKLTWSSAG